MKSEEVMNILTVDLAQECNEAIIRYYIRINRHKLRSKHSIPKKIEKKKYLSCIVKDKTCSISKRKTFKSKKDTSQIRDSVKSNQSTEHSHMFMSSFFIQ